MFLKDIEVGMFLWLQKDSQDTFGERVRILRIKNGQIFEFVSLHDGKHHSNHLTLAGERIVKIGHYTIFHKLTLAEAERFVETRSEFLEESLKRAQTIFDSFSSMKTAYFP